MKSRALGLLCFAVLCITLTLGLWPFHSPKNDVAWLNDANGLQFGRNGTVLSSDVLKAADSHEGKSGSIEICARPALWNRSATLLALYRPGYAGWFTLRQSLTDLELSVETPTFSDRKVRSHFSVHNAFGPALRLKEPLLITVTCGQEGTRVYLNGALATMTSQCPGPEVFTGRVILGDSPRQPDSFRGEVRGLAIYESELNSSAVLKHYKTWVKDGRPEITQDELNLALYLFDERAGNVIRNYAAVAGPYLYIPSHYEVVDKIALEPFWKEFDFSRSYWSGNLKNIVGFIPFGFGFFAWFRISRRTNRPILATVILGALVSLTIEVLQAFLPTRDSGTTDLIANVIGTYAGVLCYRSIYRLLCRIHSEPERIVELLP